MLFMCFIAVAWSPGFTDAENPGSNEAVLIFRWIETQDVLKKCL